MSLRSSETLGKHPVIGTFCPGAPGRDPSPPPFPGYLWRQAPDLAPSESSEAAPQRALPTHAVCSRLLFKLHGYPFPQLLPLLRGLVQFMLQSFNFLQSNQKGFSDRSVFHRNQDVACSQMDRVAAGQLPPAVNTGPEAPSPGQRRELQRACCTQAGEARGLQPGRSTEWFPWRSKCLQRPLASLEEIWWPQLKVKHGAGVQTPIREVGEKPVLDRGTPQLW